MARGRIIDKRIGKSKKFAAMKNERSRVLYLMIYPHLDVDGKFTGDPEEIKEDCCPKLRYSLSKIAESIIEMANVGLLTLYEVDGEPFIKYEKFDYFQIGIRKDREAPSLCPIPDELQVKSGVVPALYLRLNSSLSLRKEGTKDDKIIFDFSSNGFLNIKDEDIEIWKDAYPKCDVGMEIKKMGAWLIADPKRKKINYKKFINGWLSRTQDRGGTKKSEQGKSAIQSRIDELKEKESVDNK